MNININNLDSKSLKAFQHLLNEEIEDEGGLKKALIEMFANYSRQLVNYLENGEGTVPYGSYNDQLFGLLQLIAVLDADSERPLFNDLTPGDKAGNLASEEAA